MLMNATSVGGPDGHVNQLHTEPNGLTLDVGTSSVRALLYDGRGREIDGFSTQIPYQVHTTADVSVEVDADELARCGLCSPVRARRSGARTQARRSRV